jgi:hypothetical protein
MAKPVAESRTIAGSDECRPFLSLALLAIAPLGPERPVRLFPGLPQQGRCYGRSILRAVLLHRRQGREDRDCYFWFEGRDDDVITSSAYRIGPFEVESVLVQHPAVVEAAVVGKEDPERTQIFSAFCIWAPGLDRVACGRQRAPGFRQARHPSYKYPRRDPLRPRTAQDHQRQDPALRTARFAGRPTGQQLRSGPFHKHVTPEIP